MAPEVTLVVAHVAAAKASVTAVTQKAAFPAPGVSAAVGSMAAEDLKAAKD